MRTVRTCCQNGRPYRDLDAGAGHGPARGRGTGLPRGAEPGRGEGRDLAARASAADERARAAEQRAALVDGQLAERFQMLSAQALDASARRFLEMAEGRLTAANAKAAGELENRRAAVEGLVGPLKETLTRVEAQLRESDAQRAASHAALAEQMTIT